MKKTLFLSLLAAALMGVQAFAAEYKITDYEGSDLTLNAGDTLIIDTGYAYLDSLTTNGSCTLSFVCGSYFDMPSADLSDSAIDITITPNVATTWLDSFNDEERGEGGSVYVLHTESSITLTNTTFTFEGAGVGGTFTLTCETGIVGGTFVGRVNKVEDLKDGQVGWIYEEIRGDEGTVLLAGRNLSAPTTPEPATATLSLLALAGLASRRRRK